MNTFDRRRIVAATLFTVLALITLWVVGRSAPATGATAPDPAATRPPTTPYVPERPVFIGGDTSGTAFGNNDVAVAPTDGSRQFKGAASFHRFNMTVVVPIVDPGVSTTTNPNLSDIPCTTREVPYGTPLVVTNTDNGQSVRCVNVPGGFIPPGTQIVLDTPLFTQIGNLVDAPIPVRVRW